ncbi:ecto-ADP-ribosyltransferase 5 isoform X9 [Equus asinus]|uniref:ecto-ADP-ribosyltransferase 5 isoform X9 n=1 Tax=Equus asinus TaxID=9793 RepID=UPI001D03606C|nr:ecto-ADP-ribosyltransferase 5 isoform X7 [Equus asinus]
MMLAALLIALGGLSLHTLWQARPRQTLLQPRQDQGSSPLPPQVWPLSRRGLRSLTADNDLVWWLSTCVRGKECEDGAQAVPILPLGLAPDTFDDAYVGCAEEMEEKAAFLLKEEMARHALLRESWEAAQEAWEHRRRGLALPPGFKAQHGIAVMVYTNSSNTLYWELNQAVRTGGGSRESYMRTCFGAPIHALSVFPKEREVLIPPYEVFLVTRFSQDGAQSLVTLQSYNQTCSHFNCAYLGGEKKRGCVSVPTGGQPDSSSNGNFSLLPWKTLLLAPGGFLLSGAGP